VIGSTHHHSPDTPSDKRHTILAWVQDRIHTSPRNVENGHNMTEEIKQEVAKTAAEPAVTGKNDSTHGSVSFSVDGSSQSENAHTKPSKRSSGRSSFFTRMGKSFRKYVRVCSEN
jgi:hypothetical protein